MSLSRLNVRKAQDQAPLYTNPGKLLYASGYPQEWDDKKELMVWKASAAKDPRVIVTPMNELLATQGYPKYNAATLAEMVYVPETKFECKTFKTSFADGKDYDANLLQFDTTAITRFIEDVADKPDVAHKLVFTTEQMYGFSFVGAVVRSTERIKGGTVLNLAISKSGHVQLAELVNQAYLSIRASSIALGTELESSVGWMPSKFLDHVIVWDNALKDKESFHVDGLQQGSYVRGIAGIKIEVTSPPVSKNYKKRIYFSFQLQPSELVVNKLVAINPYRCGASIQSAITLKPMDKASEDAQKAEIAERVGAMFKIVASRAAVGL